MTRRASSFALVLALLIGMIGAAPAAAASAPLPSSMAAVGDSITQAASSGGSLGTDYPANSWSTGTSSTVNSHYLRLLAAGAPISGKAYNRSVSGAKVADLNAQMQNVVALQPDYVTVLIGGNDLCTDTVAGMTSVADFQSRFSTAMATLTAGSPDTYVFVSSIPNVYQLWDLFKGNWWARFIWSTAGICQSLLANPTSTQQADVQRRAAVQQRNVDFNSVLAQVCAAYARCQYDGNAVFSTAFTTSDVSGDYFHPSVAGQAKLAAVTWAAGFTFASAPPPNQAPTAAFTSACADLSCAFTNTSSDPDGGIAASSWTFGDGGTSSAASPSHTYTAAGTYTVTLTVTDTAGATATTTAPVTVSEPPATQTMWVSGLSATATSGKGSWTATATIVVSSAAGPLSGATVTGTWNATSGSCTTDPDGTCRISANVNKKTPSATFTVTGVAKAGWTWDATSGSLTTAANRP